MIRPEKLERFLTETIGFTIHKGNKRTAYSLALNNKQVLSNRISYPTHIIGHVKNGLLSEVATKLGLTPEELLAGLSGDYDRKALLLCLCVQLCHETFRGRSSDPVMHNSNVVRSQIESVSAILDHLGAKLEWDAPEIQLLRRKRNALHPYIDEFVVARILAELPAP